MTIGPTVSDALERVRNRRSRKRCPECASVVSIRGFGEYRWECLDCDAIGVGYATRADALADVRRRRE